MTVHIYPTAMLIILLCAAIAWKEWRQAARRPLNQEKKKKRFLALFPTNERAELSRAINRLTNKVIPAFTEEKHSVKIRLSTISRQVATHEANPTATHPRFRKQICQKRNDLEKQWRSLNQDLIEAEDILRAIERDHHDKEAHLMTRQKLVRFLARINHGPTHGQGKIPKGDESKGESG